MKLCEISSVNIGIEVASRAVGDGLAIARDSMNIIMKILMNKC